MVLDTASLKALEDYWLAEVMAALGRLVYGPPSPLTRRHLNDMIALLQTGDGTAMLSLPRGYTVFRARGMVGLTRISVTGFEPTILNPGACRAGLFSFRCSINRSVGLPADLWSAVFPADFMGKLLLRPPRPGDRVRPLSMGGTKKVFRVLMDAKVPRVYRPLWPVAVLGDQVLWVPGAARSRLGLYETGPALHVVGDVVDPVLARILSKADGSV